MSLRPKLGELLVAASVIDQATLDQALAKQASDGGRIGKLLIAMGAVDEEMLVRTVARQLDLPVVRLQGKQVKADVLGFLPGHVAREHRCLPVLVDRRGGDTLLVAMEDPSDNVALDQIAVAAGLPVRVVLALPSEIDAAIARHYPAKAAAGAQPDPEEEPELLLEDPVDEITPPQPVPAASPPPRAPVANALPTPDPGSTHYAAPELAKGGGELGSDLDLDLRPGGSAFGAQSADLSAEDSLDTGGPAWQARAEQLDISADDLDPGGDIDEGPDPEDSSASIFDVSEDLNEVSSTPGHDLMADSLDEAIEDARREAAAQEDPDEATGVGVGVQPGPSASSSASASASSRDALPRDAELRAVVALLIERGLLDPVELAQRLRAARRGGSA